MILPPMYHRPHAVKVSSFALVVGGVKAWLWAVSETVAEVKPIQPSRLIHHHRLSARCLLLVPCDAKYFEAR